jgi:hypothetical protein
MAQIAFKAVLEAVGLYSVLGLSTELSTGCQQKIVANRLSTGACGKAVYKV